MSWDQWQEISTGIIEILLKEMGKAYPRVRFAIPSTKIRYRPDAPWVDEEPEIDKKQR